MRNNFVTDQFNRTQLIVRWRKFITTRQNTIWEIVDMGPGWPHGRQRKMNAVTYKSEQTFYDNVDRNS